MPAFIGADAFSNTRRVEGSRLGLKYENVGRLLQDLLDDILAELIHDGSTVLRVRLNCDFGHSCQKTSLYQHPYCIENSTISLLRIVWVHLIKTLKIRAQHTSYAHIIRAQCKPSLATSGSMPMNTDVSGKLPARAFRKHLFISQRNFAVYSTIL